MVAVEKNQSNPASSAGRSFSIVTLGCAKNRVDSEGMGVLLHNRGLIQTEEPSDADVVIVNTCGFLGAARQESVDVLGELIGERKAGQFVIAAGCMPALRDYRDDLPRGVDAVLTTREWFRIGDTIGGLFGEEPQPLVAGCDGLTTTFLHAEAGPSAYVKIADGCDHACAFCTIPTIKGGQASKRPLYVLQEVVDLVARGTREIVLVSQDTIRYGFDLETAYTLPDLLDNLVEQVPDMPWLRLLYIYPNRTVTRLIDTIARHDSLVNYLDMPLQHGSPAVLRRMLRPSNMKMVRDLLDYTRSTLPDVALRTTFIVGFPGETEEEFQMLLDFVEEQEFDHVGVFTYSPEPGTVSFTMGDHVPSEVAEERRDRLMELQQSISLRKNEALVGRSFPVLIEAVGESESADGSTEPVSIGRLWRHAPEVDGMVFLPGSHAVGEFLTAQVTEAAHYDLWAEPSSELKRILRPDSLEKRPLIGRFSYADRECVDDMLHADRDICGAIVCLRDRERLVNIQN